MQNKTLIKDYITRSSARLAALETLFNLKSWADVVRESQEIVELLLKALLRQAKIEPPRIHDVSGVLEENKDVVEAILKDKIAPLIKISKSLRRDREIAFYGSEDLTPSEFYNKEDAVEAKAAAELVFKVVSKIR